MSVTPRTLAAAAAALTLTAAAIATAFLQSSPAAAAGLSPFDIAGRGATVPFVEQEAEGAVHNGTRIGPDRIYGRLPSEASGREAVTLDAAGEYVEFTLTAPANAVTFRYSLPDNAAGTGRDATIDLRVGSQAPKAVAVTSKYSWYYGGYPFNNNPGDINPHHFYDEARATFASTAAAGTKVRLQVTSTAQSPSFTIDLADFELIQQIGKPANAIDVVADFGADPTGATDNTARLQQAVDAGRAQGRVVWVPAGNYIVYDHVVLDQVTVRGIWMLARSNYQVQFQPDQELHERILFPATPSQRNGIEDARFARFRNDDVSLHRLVFRSVHTPYQQRATVSKVVLRSVKKRPRYCRPAFRRLS